GAMTRAGVVGASLLMGALGASGACTRTTELLAPAAECAAAGPVVHLGGTDDASCAGALAARFGRYALCSCDPLNVLGAFSVGQLPAAGAGPGADGGAFAGDGSDGAAAVDPRPPGAVGVNGYAIIWGPTNVNGPMIAAGPDGFKIAGGSLAGNIRSGGVVATLANVRVQGDVFAVGDVAGPYIVNGALHVQPAAMVGPDVRASSTLREPVVVAPPCACDGPPLFDIGGAVADRKTRNANQSLSFGAAFADQIADSQSFDWPCGEFYLTGIRTLPQASLEFRIHGRTAIFVDGDVRLGNNLSVTLDPGAELDLVVAGSFFTNGRIFGSPEAPARMRLWVGDRKSV